MKRFFTVLTALLLFFTFVNAQNYPKCNVCNGKKTVFKTSGVRQECNNCKNWADSYKRKVPCDFCNDNRYVIGPGNIKCNKCRGTGKGGARSPNRRQLVSQSRFLKGGHESGPHGLKSTVVKPTRSGRSALKQQMQRASKGTYRPPGVSCS